jgi:hypothetical protein
LPERIVGLGCALLCLAASACAIASHVSGTPPLFSQKGGLHMFNFEQDALHQPPEGFDPRIGRWTVEDSPTAASGTQVLVRGGEEAGALAVKNAEDVDTAAAEAATRIFLGGSGAGLACSGKAPAAGYVVKVEPNVGRMALYRKSGDTLQLLDEAQVAAQKGEWARIGIRCDRDRVVGYFNGKAVVKQRADIHGFELALYADPGVTAQFDDVTFWVPTSR